jgi:hypothetical protein
MSEAGGVTFVAGVFALSLSWSVHVRLATVRFMNLAVRSLFLAFSLSSALPALAQPVASGPAASDAPMPSVASLFTRLPSDFGNLLTVANGVVIGSAGALALAVHPGDRSMAAEVQESLKLEERLDAGEPLGSGVVHGGGATFDGRDEDEYQFGGAAVGGTVGAQIRLFPHVAAIAGFKVTRTTQHVDVGGARIDSTFTTRHAIAGLAWHTNR